MSELQNFINEYGQWIVSYKQYENGVIRFKFSDKKKCMWLKGLVCEKLNMRVKTHSNVGPIYWFEPLE